MNKKILSICLILIIASINSAGIGILMSDKEVKAQVATDAPILSSSYPAELQEGKEGDVTATCENGSSGSFNNVYLDIDRGGQICREPLNGATSLSPGDSIDCDGSFTMPNADTTINIYCYYNSGEVVESHPVVSLVAALAAPLDPADPVGPADPIGGGVTIDNPITSNTFEEFIGKIAKWLFNIALVVAPIMFVIGGFYYITAQGDPAKIKKAGDLITWTAVGLIVIMLTNGIIKLLKDMVV